MRKIFKKIRKSFNKFIEIKYFLNAFNAFIGAVATDINVLMPKIWRGLQKTGNWRQADHGQATVL